MKYLLLIALFALELFAFMPGQMSVHEANCRDKVKSAELKTSLIKVKDKCFLLLALPYKSQAKSVKLCINEDCQSFKTKKPNYKSEQITVAKDKVSPPKALLLRIQKERDEANAIYAKSRASVSLSKPFALPLSSKITSPFGTARMFNQSLKSYHSGTDFRAAVGTPIKAANDGLVVICKERYYAGGSVVIDHGAGLFSQYYHLDKIIAKCGASVKRGDLIGLSGATGRVSGAHLHFGIALRGLSVDPLSFVESFNEKLFGK